MSLGLAGQRRRNRRRLAIATAKVLLALSCILVIGWFSFRLGTERIVRVFEQYIRKYPDQWYNFFDYWQQSDKGEDHICRKN